MPTTGVSGGSLSDQRAAVRRALGRVGAWSFQLQTQSARDEQAGVAALDSVGYRALWYPESLASKEAFAHAAVLLAGSPRMVVASGIANIYARDPMAMVNGARTLGEAYPGRFILGIGVSHAPSVESRGAVYGKPIERMSAYLDAMDESQYTGPAPEGGVPVMLAALGPRMLELSAARTVGAHSYFVPVEHTRVARERLGDAVLAVEQTAVLDTDEARSTEIARAFASRYLGLPNYANNLRRLGWGEEDVAGSGSQRLLDAVIVRGDAAAIVARVREHLDAGADHVCVQLRGQSSKDVCLPAFAELAAALGELLPK